MTVSYCSAAGKRKLCLNMLPPHTGNGLAEPESVLLILLSSGDFLAQFVCLFIKFVLYSFFMKKRPKWREYLHLLEHCVARMQAHADYYLKMLHLGFWNIVVSSLRMLLLTTWEEHL